MAVALAIHDHDADVALTLLDRLDVKALAVLGLGDLDQAVGVVDEVDLPIAELLHLDVALVLLLGEVEGVLVLAEVALNNARALDGLVRDVLHRGGHRCLRRSGHGLHHGARCERGGLRDRLGLSSLGAGDGVRCIRLGDGGFGALVHRGGGIRLALLHHDGLRCLGHGRSHRLGALTLDHGLGHRRGDVLDVGAGRADGLRALVNRLHVLGHGALRALGHVCRLGRALGLHCLGHGLTRDGARHRRDRLRRLGHRHGLHGDVRAARTRVETLQARLRDGDDALGGALIADLVAEVVVLRHQDGDVLTLLHVGRDLVKRVRLGQVVTGLAELVAKVGLDLKTGPLGELGGRDHRHAGARDLAADLATDQVKGLLVVGQQGLQRVVDALDLCVVAVVVLGQHPLGTGDSSLLHVRVNLQRAAINLVVTHQAGHTVKLAHLVLRIVTGCRLRNINAPARAVIGGVNHLRRLTNVLGDLLLDVKVHGILQLIARELGVHLRHLLVCLSSRGDSNCTARDDSGGNERRHNALL